MAAMEFRIASDQKQAADAIKAVRDFIVEVAEETAWSGAITYAQAQQALDKWVDINAVLPELVTSHFQITDGKFFHILSVKDDAAARTIIAQAIVEAVKLR